MTGTTTFAFQGVGRTGWSGPGLQACEVHDGGIPSIEVFAGSASVARFALPGAGRAGARLEPGGQVLVWDDRGRLRVLGESGLVADLRL